MNLILFEPNEVLDDGEVRLSATDRRAIHCSTVLKVEVGSIVRVGIIGGIMGEATCTESSMEWLKMQITKDGFVKEQPSACLNMSLILAMPRPRVLDRLWPIFSQLGLRRVILVNASRVEKCYFSSHILEEKHYRPRLIKGLEQAAVSTQLPQIDIDTRSFEVFLDKRLETAFPNTRRFVGHPYPLSNNTAETQIDVDQEIVLAIGPEGGWQVDELENLAMKNFVPVCCSTRIFTTEVAIVALASAVATHCNPALLGEACRK